ATLTGNRVDGAFVYGIQVTHCAPLVAKYNVVTGTASNGWPPAAMLLQPISATIGPGQDIDGNEGFGNAVDAIVLSGDVRAGFAWVTPSNAAVMHPLGYLLG